ncbi:hypothetical protein [Candidatus Poriferisocius sp.]|uniref:hypothetical protein n=1 Tax=Candidatus Poriferisocius sp. TaxID=3101276 RepID=UPI003B529054
MERYTAPGVKGSTLTDEQRKVLRSKNTNVATQVGDKVIAPPGGGLMAYGSNLKCKSQAMRLLTEIRRIEKIFEDHWDEREGALRSAGFEDPDSADLRLARIADSSVPPSQLRSMNGDLSWIGWAIVEVSTGTLIDWSF